MCFHFLIIDSSTFPIEFPTSFHQISPFVYKASYFASAHFFLSIESCFFKAVKPPRLVVSFFPDLFPSIFQLNASTTNQFPYITDWFILNEYNLTSFVWIAFLSISSHLSPTWFFNFLFTHLSFDWMNILLLIAPVFNWQFLLSRSAFLPPAVFLHSDFTAHSVNILCPVCKTSLAICLTFILSDY